MKTSELLLLLAALIGACVLLLNAILPINPEPPHIVHHTHVEVNRYWARGMKSVPVIMCMEERAQVIFGTDHKETELSVEYFSE